MPPIAATAFAALHEVLPHRALVGWGVLSGKVPVDEAAL
ncbi:hypothetical protein AKJ09_01061 [Labilithrix luteola]|uniref:Uncharacterized protein n=1 Tax=Labilithrix luteola TaxID=1391654 RepID=A0A0K1PLJ6_9BACT|nr:hypothetical protein AKJ09_01061 [Labilithrix luteola]